MGKRVSEAVARPVRTAGQLVPAVVIVDVVDAFVTDLDERQYGVAVAALTLLISWVQTVVENHYGRALLRQVPPTTVPVVDTPPA